MKNALTECKIPNKLFYWTDQQAVIDYINTLPADEPIVLIGHSYGGDTAWNVADSITRNIDLLVTLDPVSWLSNIIGSKPGKVRKWINVYADQDGYSWNDFIADLGGQWGIEDSADVNITGNADHNDPSSMLKLKIPGTNTTLCTKIKQVGE